MDSTKIQNSLGWKPRHVFESGLKETVDWYRANGAWTERVRSGAYRAYYDSQYAGRLAATGAKQ
jgi:dTDP-glucose 4,6-dehydratase